MELTVLFIAVAVFLLSAGGLEFGRWLARHLPPEHFVSEARTSAQIGIGMLATLAALVLGLMITSAKSSFDDRHTEIVSVATSIVLLDRALAGYGEESQQSRQRLSHIHRVISERVSTRGYITRQAFETSVENLLGLTQLQESILAMVPKDERQRWFQSRALTLSTELAHERVLSVERGDRSIPTTLLVVVTVWVALIFVGVGMFAVINRTVTASLLVCALAFAGAIFIILELDTPYSGLIGVSSQPLVDAGAVLGR
jgi:hypothetical protein